MDFVTITGFCGFHEFRFLGRPRLFYADFPINGACGSVRVRRTVVGLYIGLGDKVRASVSLSTICAY